MVQLLIIEDDPYVQRVYQRLFSAKNYSFEIVSNGEDGLKKAKSLKPELILLDIMMSPMDGMVILKKLKENKETADIPVVMLTNLGEDEYIKEAYSLGASGYMIKSDFSPEEVLNEVDKYLKKNRSSLLIIEDDPFVVRFYVRLFDSSKYDVKTATDGETGLELIKSFTPDLILLDLILPKMSGVDVLKALKSDSKTKEYPVLILSNVSDAKVMGEAASLGADAFIIKSSISPEDLKKEVDIYLQSGQDELIITK